MSKESYTKLTLAELIAKKEQAKNAKKQPLRKELYIESLGGTITVEEPNRDILSDSVELDNKGQAYMVYQCCVDPCLKSSELLEGVSEPDELVHMLFKPGEISFISNFCLEMAGFKEGSVRLVDSLKN